MNNNKEQRRSPAISKRFWIIGAGRFGRIAVLRIKDRKPGAVITVVDKKPVHFNDSDITVVCQDGITWLSTMLSTPIHKYDGIRLPMHPGSLRCSARQELRLLAASHALRTGCLNNLGASPYLRTGALNEQAPVDWIVPAIPIHVAKQWLVRKISNHFNVKPVPVPDEWLMKIPHALRGETGQVYASHADFTCPDDCPEPKNRCTHTANPRPMDLFRLLKRLEIDEVLPIVLRSHQLAPGVGGLLRQELFDAFQTVMENVHRRLMIATACRCHGVVDFVRLEQVSSPHPFP